MFGMLYFIISKKVKVQLKLEKKICAVYREITVTDQTCQKWFADFHAGDFSLDVLQGEVNKLKLIVVI